MAEIKFELATFEIADIATDDGLPENAASVGDVVRDSATIETSDGNITKHYAELKQYPIIVVPEIGDMMIKFKLFDLSADNVVKYIGGTVTPGAGGTTADSLAFPTGIVKIEKAIILTDVNGGKLTVHRALIMAKLSGPISRNSGPTLEVTAYVLDPEFAISPIKLDDYTLVGA